LALKQDPEVAHYAATYLRWLLLGLPAYGFNNVARRYFQSQGLFDAPTRITILVAPINVILNYILGTPPCSSNAATEPNWPPDSMGTKTFWIGFHWCTHRYRHLLQPHFYLFYRVRCFSCPTDRMGPYLF